MELRTMRFDDVPAAARVAVEALPVPDGFDDDQRLAWFERRTAHLVEHHPTGSWLALEDGEVIGMANAIIHDGIWGLSTLAVLPDRHARGAGRTLLHHALTSARGTRGQIIMSSQDPKAMRIYSRAGFHLLPAVALSGILDRSVIPTDLRSRATEDLEAVAVLARAVRGGAYGPQDLALMLTRAGSGVRTIDGRGFVLYDESGPNVLVADSAGVATDLLWSALAETPRGGTVGIAPITAGQDWAIRAALEARLALSPEGPMFVRGELGTLRPWIASGMLL